MPDKTIFAVDNFNHLRNLNYIFKDENVGFFYRDKNWIIINGYRNEMTNRDLIMLENYLPIIIESNKVYRFDFKDENSVHGLGWTHNYGDNQKGIWSEGNTSNIIFGLDEKVKDKFKVKIKVNSIITKDNNPLILETYVNENLYEKLNIKSIKDLEENYIVMNLNKANFKENIVHINIVIKNPITKLELLQSPDARRLGILVENIQVDTLNL